MQFIPNDSLARFTQDAKLAKDDWPGVRGNHVLFRVLKSCHQLHKRRTEIPLGAIGKNRRDVALNHIGQAARGPNIGPR